MSQIPNPEEIDTPEVAEIKDELGSFAALEAVANSEGGQLLISSHMKDVVSIVDSLGANYNVYSHTQLMAMCAEMKTKLDMVRTLTRAEKNKTFMQETLDAALRQ